MIDRDLLLERLGGAARAAVAAGATDAEASHRGAVLGTTRFAGSTFTQAGVVEERATRVRAAVGDRIGAATTASLTPDELAATARRAVEAARHGPPSPGFAGFARPDPARAPRTADEAGWAEATAACTPADRADLLAEVFARAARERLTCAGSFITSAEQLAVMTTGGVARAARGTRAALALIALDGDASGHASWVGADLGRLDAAALADTAVTRGARSRDAREVEPGPWDVVLLPAAVAELLEWLAIGSFSARAVLDGTSLLAGREGERVCSPAITIFDDPGTEHPDVLPTSFDAEGTLKTPVTLIDRGVAGRPVTDLATATRLGDGRGSTGHAPLAGELFDGPLPAHLVLAPGADSEEELIARVDRGLLVTRFHYVNGYLDTRRATMTGMTRDGTFLIERGRIGPAVRNLRFTESLLEAFSRVGGVGRSLAAVPTQWLAPGAILAPALLLRGFRFTGRSR